MHLDHDRLRGASSVAAASRLPRMRPPSLLALAALLAAGHATAAERIDPALIERAYDTAAIKLANHDDRFDMVSGDVFPDEAADNQWHVVDARNWASGFYPGALWMMYEHAGEPQWRARAEKWTAGLEGQQHNTRTHDVGFMILGSFGQGHRLLDQADPLRDSYEGVILTAAESLSSRYVPEPGTIRSWNTPSDVRVIIDNMMNLDLLFWADQRGGSSDAPDGSSLYDIAITHANTTLAYHVRADGSTYHVVDFDENTGQVIDKLTVQGKSDDSTWARGQAWGLYGFTTTYRHTRHDQAIDPQRYLDAARSLADYWIDHVPDDGVPWVDFDSAFTDDVHDHGNRDASAAAIASAGLLQLSQLVDDPLESHRYFREAEQLLGTLLQEPYFSADPDVSPSLLLHASRDYQFSAPGGSDISYIWADYYLLESLHQYQAITADLLGDMNLDGLLDAADVAPFVLALTDPQAYEDQYDSDPLLVGDINGDGVLDAVDVAPFVQMLVGSDGVASVPEPGSLGMLGLGGLMLLRRRATSTSARATRSSKPG
ncbi:MAG: PEP-CTERM sorting domain-containing protein [Phycisphaeraceae bacterium]